MNRASLVSTILPLIVSFGAIDCSSDTSLPSSESGGAESAGGAAGNGGESRGGSNANSGGKGGGHSGGPSGRGGSDGPGAAGGADNGETGGGSTGGSANSGGSIAKGGAGGAGGSTSRGGAAPGSGGRSGPDAGGGRDGGAPSSGGRNAGGSVDGGRAGSPSQPDAGGSGGSSAYSPCPTSGEPCKILPLGDSITHGLQSSDNGGYRSQLFKLVVAANQNITFTGSQSSGPSQVSGKTFPKNHEGHDGWTVEPGYSKYGSDGVSSLVPKPAFDTMPGIVLLMIGTNDITSSSSPGSTADRLDGLLDKVVEAAPDALIVVAQLTPVNWSSSDLTNYNAKIPGIVQARVAKGQHVVSVDMSKMPTSGLAADGVHPNDQGYAYMANIWYQAIGDILPKGP